MEVRDIWPVTAHRDLRDHHEPWVARVAVALTAVRRTTSPETAHKAVLASVVKAAERPDLTTAINAVSLVTLPVIAQTLPLRVSLAEAEIVSDAVRSVTLPEIAQTLK